MPMVFDRPLGIQQVIAVTIVMPAVGTAFRDGAGGHASQLAPVERRSPEPSSAA